MKIELQDIKVFLKMMSMTMGDFAEITLCDREQYLFVENPLSEKKAGDKIGDDEKNFLENENLNKLPFVANYKSLLPNMSKLRSSTYFIKDGEGQIEYMISFSTNVESLLLARHILDNFINGSRFNVRPATRKVDNTPRLNLSLSSVISNVINEGEHKYNTTIARMTMKEKQSLIREMYSRGVFLIKGAVPEVSQKLENSEATVYRYLKKLEKEEQ
ncbi:MAG: helix-turn-helix domain-containing protein [Sphaerochaetaceae bacterium]